jgi:hypothetical protein
MSRRNQVATCSTLRLFIRVRNTASWIHEGLLLGKLDKSGGKRGDRVEAINERRSVRRRLIVPQRYRLKQSASLYSLAHFCRRIPRLESGLVVEPVA